MSADESENALATFEAAFLPGWEWTVLEIEERAVDIVTELDDDGEPVTTTSDLYYGTVSSPNTHGRPEYGTFSAHELRQAGAFRTDRDTGEWP